MKKYLPRKRKITRRFTGPTGLDSILSSALKRHGINRQVTAAMIVVKANELIDSQLDDHLKRDVKVISFAKNVILVACRHPAAVYEAQGFGEVIKKNIEEEFPSITIEKVFFHINQEPWGPGEYN